MRPIFRLKLHNRAFYFRVALIPGYTLTPIRYCKRIDPLIWLKYFRMSQGQFELFHLSKKFFNYGNIQSN